MKWQPSISVVFVLAIAVRSSANPTEPNDTIADASRTGLVGEGATYEDAGILGDGDWLERDVDIYSFELSQETTFPVLVTADVLSEAPRLDSFLRLFDANGAEIANNDDASFSSSDSLIEVLVLTPGTYYAGVSTAANPHYDGTLAGSGRLGDGGAYTLRIRAKSVPDSTGEMEPNDHIDAASPMGGASFVVSEYIGDGAHGRLDVDIYKLVLVGAAKIEVRVDVESIGSPLKPVVRIRNCVDGIDIRTQPDECSIGSNDSVANGSADAVSSAGVLHEHDVYISVSGRGNRRFDPAISGSGEPGSIGPYRLDATVTYVEVGGESEPNDSMQMATLLDLDAPESPDVVGLVGSVGDGPFGPFQGDRDFYEVKLRDDARILSIDVESLSRSSLRPVVVAYDPHGIVVMRNENMGLVASAGLFVPIECVRTIEDTQSVFVAVMGTGQRPPSDPFLPFPGATAAHPDALGDGPGSTGTYHLLVDGSPESASCGNEPDNVLSTATETGLIDRGSYVCLDGELGASECLDPESDVDIWSFAVEHPPVRLEARLATCRTDALPRYSISLFNDAAELRGFLPVYDATDHTRALIIQIDQPGRYFVTVRGFTDPQPFDPTIACHTPVAASGTFDLILRLDRGIGGAGLRRGGSDDMDAPAAETIFATVQNQESNRIDAVDANTGEVLRSHSAPETLAGGSEGLAYDGIHLFYLGTGMFPHLYRLDPVTGDTIGDTLLWMGSGSYSDAVILGSELFILDYRSGRIHVIDPDAGYLRALDVGRQNDMTLAGGLAALSAPDRLYIADAFNTRNIVEIDPVLGTRTATLAPPAGISRPTALAGSGTSSLWVGDWQSDTLAKMDRGGDEIGEIVLDGEVGALAGAATSGFFGDFDFDGDVDLRDFAKYQVCLTGLGELSIGECVPGNRNGDESIDLTDYASFPAAMTGP